MSSLETIQLLELHCIEMAKRGINPHAAKEKMMSETYNFLEGRNAPAFNPDSNLPTERYIGVVEMPKPARRLLDGIEPGDIFDVLSYSDGSRHVNFVDLQAAILGGITSFNEYNNKNVICTVSRSSDKVTVKRIQ